MKPQVPITPASTHGQLHFIYNLDQFITPFPDYFETNPRHYNFPSTKTWVVCLQNKSFLKITTKLLPHWLIGNFWTSSNIQGVFKFLWPSFVSIFRNWLVQIKTKTKCTCRIWLTYLFLKSLILLFLFYYVRLATVHYTISFWCSVRDSLVTSNTQGLTYLLQSLLIYWFPLPFLPLTSVKKPDLLSYRISHIWNFADCVPKVSLNTFFSHL